MPTVLIRVAAVVTSIAATGGYLYSLLLFTYGTCYLQEVGCAAGWIARTLSTLAYLAVVAAVIATTRWSLRLSAERVAAPARRHAVDR